MGGTRLPGEAELLTAVPALNSVDPDVATKMPLEARMYGIFAAFLIAWILALVWNRGRMVMMPPGWLLFTFLAFIAVMGFDGINATLYDLNSAGLPIPYLYAPRLDLRLATGLLSGIGMAGIMLPLVNYSLWRNQRAEPIFAGARQLLGLLLVNAVFFLLVVSGSGLFLYPLSALGVLGVIVLIGALNVVVILSAFGRSGSALNWRETLNPFAFAVLMTAVELGGLSLLRYAIRGTAIPP